MNKYQTESSCSPLDLRNQVRRKNIQAARLFATFIINNIGFLMLFVFAFIDQEFFQTPDSTRTIILLTIGIGGLLSYFFVVDIRVWLVFCFLESLILLWKVYVFLAELSINQFQWIGLISCLALLSEMLMRYRWLRHFSSRKSQPQRQVRH